MSGLPSTGLASDTGRIHSPHAERVLSIADRPAKPLVATPRPSGVAQHRTIGIWEVTMTDAAYRAAREVEQ